MSPHGRGETKLSSWPVCAVGSRWHTYAFTEVDELRLVTTQLCDTDQGSCGPPSSEGASTTAPPASPGLRLQLWVGGVLRTELDASAADVPPFSAATALRICEGVESRVGGAFELRPTIGDAGSCVGVGNPPIRFRVPDFGNTALLVQQRFEPLALTPDTYLLSSADDACDRSAAFARAPDGTYLRHDRRLRLLRNTAEAPSLGDELGDEPAEWSGAPACPAVTPFLSKRGCARRPACSPPAYSAASKVLDAALLRALFRSGRKPFYAIEGLRLDQSTQGEPHAGSPCDEGRSRWRRLAGPCDAPTALDAETIALVRRAVASSADANPFVLDLDLRRSAQESGGTCTAELDGVSATGARVDVDSGGPAGGPGGASCYEHVHPALLNVYDFSYHALVHDGNDDVKRAGEPNPILAPAFAGDAVLSYPGANHRWPHPMRRWHGEATNFPLLGRYGDAVAFASLPPAVQTASAADLFGSVGSAPTHRSCYRLRACAAGASGPCERSSEAFVTLGAGYAPSDFALGAYADGTALRSPGGDVVDGFTCGASAGLRQAYWHVETPQGRSHVIAGSCANASDAGLLPAQTLEVEVDATGCNAYDPPLASSGFDTGFEACGSPGEVANEPALGHRYHFSVARRIYGEADLYRRYALNNGEAARAARAPARPSRARPPPRLLSSWLCSWRRQEHGLDERRAHLVRPATPARGVGALAGVPRLPATRCTRRL